MSRICTITVRAGSKGVPGKNWRPLLGLPLYAHSIRHALDSGLFDEIAVTSDAPEVLDAAADFGATQVVVRPAELATDSAAKVPAILHAVKEVERRRGSDFDIVVDLDATSPLRIVDDIRGAVDLLEITGSDAVITGAISHRSPYFNLVEERPDGTVGLAKQLPTAITRRQDVPRTFDMNASIYVWRRASLEREPVVFAPTTRLYEMPAIRSRDIDADEDFEYVEWLMMRRGR